MATLRSEVPSRADGLQLIGEMEGSGYRIPPSLVRRGDGQTIQLTPVLYRTLEAVDGRRTYREIAELVTQQTGRPVSEENVRALVDERLRPLGLLTRPDGSQPEVKKSNPLLGLRFRVAVTDPDRTRRITEPFARLFSPLVVVPVLVAFVVVCWWVFLEQGLASATREAFERPGLLLLVFAITILSAGFHEFGHAAAARRGGATPGVMGAGLYLVWPAFYTDVTDSYRLGRRQRVWTDVGGLYFNAIVAVAITLLWVVLRYDALLLVVATQILQMVRQLLPLVRFDGYHVLADVTGVPDLYHRIKPTLLGLLPWRRRDPAVVVLKPWARAVVTAWVFAVIPILLLTFAMIVLAFPRVLATAWEQMQEQRQALSEALGRFDVVQVAARTLMIVAIALPVLAALYLMLRVARRALSALWNAGSGSRTQRALAGATTLALFATVAWSWWPDPSTYRPIQVWERGTLTDGLAAIGLVSSPEPATFLAGGQRGNSIALLDTEQRTPSADDPTLALVLVPRGDPEGAPAWVFPFDRPLAPDPGDNQALAINTADGTVVYDAAFALVWVEDGAAALNTNEAYAFASCTSCAAVAIGFQVVLVLGDNDVAVPQNLSAAVNSGCVNCLTYALAQQLFVTVAEPLSEEAVAELDALWAEIADYAESIEAGAVPLDEIATTLDGFEDRILEIVGVQPATSPSPAASPSASPSASATASASPEPSASASGSTSADPSPSRSGSPSPSASPNAGASPSRSPSPSPSPSPTASTP